MMENPHSSPFEGLVSLGLSRNEAETYLALLRLGGATAGQIAKRSGIHVRTTYDSLDALLNKGFVTYVDRGGARVYSACGLDALTGFFEEKARMAESVAAALAVGLERADAPMVRVFVGRSGLRAVMEAMLKAGRPMYFYGGSMLGFRRYLPEYCRAWNARRERMGLAAKSIYLDHPGVRESFDGLKRWAIRPLPKASFSSVAWWLYGDNMALVFWSEEPLAVVIHSPELAHSYHNFFSVVWRAAGNGSRGGLKY